MGNPARFTGRRTTRAVFSGWTVIGALLAVAALLLSATPATAAPVSNPKPTTNPWQMRHWPQTQPWQQKQTSRSFGQGAPTADRSAELRAAGHDDLGRLQGDPGHELGRPGRKGSIKRTFKGALVLVDYPNQPFVGHPAARTPPSSATRRRSHDIPRDQVPEFYQDFLNTPSTLNRGHTIHEYWMEDSGGRYGVDLTAFGPYRMPGKIHEYGIEFQGGAACPAGDTCDRDFRTDARAAWVADVGADVADAVRLRLLPQRRPGRVVRPGRSSGR